MKQEIQLIIMSDFWGVFKIIVPKINSLVMWLFLFVTVSNAASYSPSSSVFWEPYTAQVNSRLYHLDHMRHDTNIIELNNLDNDDEEDIDYFYNDANTMDSIP
ncbi:MAG: hypothetical protein WCO98_14040, partial [bacterium]